MNAVTYKVTCTLANTAYNVVTGTVNAPTTTAQVGSANKGRGITFQCQTNGALGKFGMSDVVSNAGIQAIGPDGSYTPISGNTSTAYNASEWWVASDTAGAVIVVQLIRSI